MSFTKSKMVIIKTFLLYYISDYMYVCVYLKMEFLHEQLRNVKYQRKNLKSNKRTETNERTNISKQIAFWYVIHLTAEIVCG